MRKNASCATGACESAALVSMLSLETAMLTRFGAAEDPVFRQSMTAATRAGISAIVLGMAVFMILRSAKALGQTRQENLPRRGGERAWSGIGINSFPEDL